MERRFLIDDFWGGMGAMLVALPSAIAFGVTIFAPLGGTYAALGAIAGILGATALGLVAPAIGGTSRLISAPCAPAAAILSALAIQLSSEGMRPESVLIMIALVCALAGVLQIVFGVVGIGRLIKYMPYPVVSGYLTGVGLIIIASQVPKFLGAPAGTTLAQSVTAPVGWNAYAIGVGLATIGLMILAPRLTRAVPAAIVGLAGGVTAYFCFAFFDPALLRFSGNPLLVGPLGGEGGGFAQAFLARWNALGAVGMKEIVRVAVPAATLAVLLSIDTLKTCLVLDAMTRSRHNSNRELVGQGLANVASTAIGGLPGSGTMGATLVNLSSGGRTQVSGLFEGALALVAFLALGSVIGWMPIAALAGLLIYIGVRMIDWQSFSFLRNRSTILDFVVIAAVVIVAVSYSLVAASGVGIALAVMLFIREQIGGAVVHRKTTGDQVFSKQVRLPEEMAILQKRGAETAVFELQGSLFFGTVDQLYTALEPELKTRRYLILDLQRVQSVDISAAHMLEQIEGALKERTATLILSAVSRLLPGGRDLGSYLDEVGVVGADHHVRVFDELDEALEWVENRLIEEEHLERGDETPLPLSEIDLFTGRKEETLAELGGCMEQRSFKAGDRIFSRGDVGDELYVIRRGAVRILLPLNGAHNHHLATFGRGNFFGEMSFLDQEARSADAIALTDTDLYVLSRKKFDEFVSHHKKVAGQVLGRLARMLAVRLRYANAELRALRDPGLAS